MLKARFNIEAIDGEQLTLVLRDECGDYDAVYNPDGYGAPNIERLDVDYIVLTIMWPDGSVTDRQIMFKPTGYALFLDAVTFCPQKTSMSGVYAVGPPGSFPVYVQAYPDGWYNVTYSIYSRKGVPATKCDFTATGAFEQGGKVFANINGGWFDITSTVTQNVEGSTVISFTSTILQTSSYYGLYQTRKADGTLLGSGYYTQSNCSPDTGTVTVSDPVMIASATKEFVLTGRTIKASAPLVYSTLDSEATTPEELKRREDIVLANAQLLYLQDQPSFRRCFETFPVIHALLF